MEMNIMATIDPEVATMICDKHGFIFEVSSSEGDLD
jgi:hypothetical protein